MPKPLKEDALDELAALARADLLPEWEAVAAGTRSADEAALISRARGIDMDTINRARELFRPIDDTTIIKAILGE